MPGILEQFGNVMVQCPMPGQEHQPAQRLDEFMQTEVGARVLGPSLANVEIMTNAGMETEQAVTIALGAAVVRDEEGTMMRAFEPAPELVGADATESKKK